ncbi:MAG: 6-carboxytetrahydropterin synthase QueD [Syntrophomonas sp.]|nr:6-carboxytetrahydropterin synthase QueD [Syntrophomonas sp.]
MYEISVALDFAAAHKLNNYYGQCSNLHGHTWRVEVSVASPQLNESSMVMDFRDLKSALLAILNRYDHGYLNEISPFDVINPTAENIAREIYGEIKGVCTGCKLSKVKVWESAGSCASYWEE